LPTRGNAEHTRGGSFAATVKNTAIAVFFMVRRAAGIVARPGATWRTIRSERVPLVRVLLGYALPLAAIGPLATFVALRIVGVALPSVGVYRVSPADASSAAAELFGLAIAGVLVLALCVNVLAPAFGAQRSFARALRVSAYALTPAWLAGVFRVYPPLGALQLLAALYVVYVLYLGLCTVLGVSRRAALPYALAALAAAILCPFVFIVLLANLYSLGAAGRAVL